MIMITHVVDRNGGDYWSVDRLVAGRWVEIERCSTFARARAAREVAEKRAR